MAKLVAGIISFAITKILQHIGRGIFLAARYVPSLF
jgi:hypothetical protein